MPSNRAREAYDLERVSQLRRRAIARKYTRGEVVEAIVGVFATLIGQRTSPRAVTPPKKIIEQVHFNVDISLVMMVD